MGNDGVMLNQDFIILMSKLITRDCRKCSNKVFVSRTATEYLERTPTNFRREGIMEQLNALVKTNDNKITNKAIKQSKMLETAEKKSNGIKCRSKSFYKEEKKIKNQGCKQ